MTLLEWMKRWREGRARLEESAQARDEGEDDNMTDPFNPFPEPVRIEIKDIIDLHTMQAKDVRRVVEEYLLEARAAGFRSVRIIHGKGVGVQREIVRSVLKRTPFVVDWMDAPPTAGGMGATIAHLSLKDD